MFELRKLRKLQARIKSDDPLFNLIFMLSFEYLLNSARPRPRFLSFLPFFVALSAFLASEKRRGRSRCMRRITRGNILELALRPRSRVSIKHGLRSAISNFCETIGFNGRHSQRETTVERSEVKVRNNFDASRVKKIDKVHERLRNVRGHSCGHKNLT